MNLTRRPPRGGFTLVEMLVVIAIIAILTSLITVAVFAALNRARDVVIGMEMTQMDQAIQKYVEVNQDYPPCLPGDFNGTTSPAPEPKVVLANAFMKHMMKAYRNGPAQVFFTGSSGSPGTPGVLHSGRPLQVYNPMSDLAARNLTNMDAAETYVYFLGGGLLQNKTRPIPTAVLTTEKNSHFAFEGDRLVDADNDGFYEYVPPYGDRPTPYVYFRSDVYIMNPADPNAPVAPSAAAKDVARWPFQGSTAYKASEIGVTRPWLAANSNVTTPPLTMGVNGTGGNIIPEGKATYQFHCPGLDGLYGDPTVTPASGVDPGDVADPTNYQTYYYHGPLGLNWAGVPRVRDNQMSFSENGQVQKVLP